MMGLRPRSWPVVALAFLWLAPMANADTLDCDDVDHECPADASVATGIQRAGTAVLHCLKNGAASCDLNAALAGITSQECRDAVECQLGGLRDLLSDGSTSCAQQLFREAYKFMAKKAKRIARGQRAAIPGDLAHMKEKAGARCTTPINPPLAGNCRGPTTPAEGASCIGDAADTLSTAMLPEASSCKPPPASPPAAPPVSSAVNPPNFIIILSDDQRWDTVDATHQSPNRPGPVMPFVTNKLVNKGVTFTNGHVTTALCCPSRSSILRSQYAHRTGVLDNDPPDGGAQAFDDTSTIATWLHSAPVPYRTGFVGKYLNGYNKLSPCIPPGWDEWHVQVQVKYYEYDLNDNGVITHFDSRTQDYSGDVMTQRALAFINAFDGRPFFLHLSQKAPHGPATPAPRHIGLFNGIASFRPLNYAEDDATDKPAWVQGLTWDKRGCDTCPPGKKCDACETDKFRQLQLESLQAVDEGVRDIVNALAGIGQLQNTLIIYTGDNGYAWGSHRWKPKQCPYQECIRVPMVMRYDALVNAPRTDDRFVLNIDFAPTFLELAGATVPPGYVVNGQSVVPLLSGGAAGGWRAAMLNEHFNGKIPTNALVKQGRCSTTIDTTCKKDAHCPSGETCIPWKYVEYVTAETELYNLNADPFELTNVTNVPANAAVKAKLATKLHQLQAE